MEWGVIFMMKWLVALSMSFLFLFMIGCSASTGSTVDDNDSSAAKE